MVIHHQKKSKQTNLYLKSISIEVDFFCNKKMGLSSLQANLEQMFMRNDTTQKETWSLLGTFFFFLILFSAIAYYAILKLNPTSIYVGSLMMSPALATFTTLLINGKLLSSLP